jgi:hypothetical protein
MEPTTFDQEMACDRQAYEELKEQIRRDYAGQYVAIAFGKIVAVRRTFDDAKAAIEALQPAPEHYLVFLPRTKNPHLRSLMPFTRNGHSLLARFRGANNSFVSYPERWRLFHGPHKSPTFGQ